MLHTVKAGKGQWDVMHGDVRVGSIWRVDKMMQDPRWPWFIDDFAGLEPDRMRDAMHRLSLEVKRSKRIRSPKRVFKAEIDRAATLDQLRVRCMTQAASLRHEYRDRYGE